VAFSSIHKKSFFTINEKCMQKVKVQQCRQMHKQEKSKSIESFMKTIGKTVH
jgi:hypothetical protein